MKRLPAIFFFAVLLFNFYGYRIVIDSLSRQSEAVIEAKADQQDYADNELVSVKTVLHLPYYNSSKEFERVYGSVNINGVDYEYVKRRVYNDTLEVLCLPNHTKSKLKAVGHELAKAGADGATPAKNGGGTVKICFPDFCQPLSEFRTIQFTTNASRFTLSNTRLSSADHSLQQERPPQVA